MFTKKWFRMLVLAAAIAAPLLVTAAANAESGCHRDGGKSGQSTPTLASAQK